MKYGRTASAFKWVVQCHCSADYASSTPLSQNYTACSSILTRCQISFGQFTRQGFNTIYVQTIHGKSRKLKAGLKDAEMLQMSGCFENHTTIDLDEVKY